jgi:hypothetical protein
MGRIDIELNFKRGESSMEKSQLKIRRGESGDRRIGSGTWGAMMMKISTLMALVTVMGCITNSNGGGNSPITSCDDPPPDTDTKKITAGMYVESGLDSLKLPFYAQAYHSNGIVYFRIRNYPDSTTSGLKNIAEESWNRYLDTGSGVIWAGTGGQRKDYTPLLTAGYSGGWSQAWEPPVGFVSFFKRNVTASSFQTVKKNEVRDSDHNLLGCTWEARTYTRIGSERSAWPSVLSWPEVWPDSVARK